MLRSVGSVILGYVTYMVLAVAFDFAMMVVMQGLPPREPSADEGPHLIFVYSVANVTAGTLWATLSGYVTAWVARRREQLHANVLAGIGTVVGTLLSLDQAYHPPQGIVLPTFYLVAIPLLTLLFVPLGGWLRAKHVRDRGLTLEAR